jgi:D-glycero-D-manno-heptose 1,7-bisphosphate phosphatase
MKKKAVFLDRDGTINIEKNYLYKIDDFEFLPGAMKGLKILQDAGYLLIVITNQSGIGRGYYTEKDYEILNQWMLDVLKYNGVYINNVYYCPHLSNAKIEKYRKNCTCRKPALGMYLQAIKDFDIDIENSWAIGDKIRDCFICENTKCQGFLIGKNEKSEIIDAVKDNKYKNLRYAVDLLESAKMIVSNMEG